MQAEPVRTDLDFRQFGPGRIRKSFSQGCRKTEFAAALERNHDQPASRIVASGSCNRPTRYRRRAPRMRLLKLLFRNRHEFPSTPRTTVEHEIAVAGPRGSLAGESVVLSQFDRAAWTVQFEHRLPRVFQNVDMSWTMIV